MQISSIGRCLLLTFGGEMRDDEFTTAKGELLDRVQQLRPVGVIFDFSPVRIMDQAEFDRARRLARTASLLGTRTLLVGFQPEVVHYLIAANADLSGFEVAGGVDEALDRIGLAWRSRR